MLSRKNNNAHPADYDREQWTTASWVTEFRTNAAYETQIFNFLKDLTKNVFYVENALYWQIKIAVTKVDKL